MLGCLTCNYAPDMKRDRFKTLAFKYWNIRSSSKIIFAHFEDVILFLSSLGILVRFEFSYKFCIWHFRCVLYVQWGIIFFIWFYSRQGTHWNSNHVLLLPSHVSKPPPHTSALKVRPFLFRIYTLQMLVITFANLVTFCKLVV